MLRLILGLTGSGKTREVFSRAMDCARQRHRTILLVPEQFSFQAERRVYTALRGEDALAISVLSFSRLSENIFRAMGGLARKRLTDAARLVLMRLAVEEMEDTLELYGRQKDRVSFLNTMLGTVEELKQSGAGPGQLLSAAARVGDARLAAKLRDVGGIYEAYQAMVDRDYSDPLDDIEKAAALAEEGRYFEGCRIFIDGFDHFSPPERRMLHAMLEQGEEVCLSLCADGLDTCEGEDLFTNQKKTARGLLRYAREHFVPAAVPVRLEENRRAAAPALRAAGELARGAEPEPCSGEGLGLFSARDRYGEARFAAAEISRLVREEGWRYRDLALVCRDLEDYRSAISSAFAAYGLPVFMARKDPPLSRPVVTFAAAALEAVSGGYRTEAVLKVARSPALALGVETAAALENYAYVWSVEGKAWLRPFRNHPQGLRDEAPERYARELALVEEARLRVTGPLRELEAALAPGDGVSFAKGLYAFFEATGALRNLREYFSADPDHGLERGRENSRLWEYMVDVLDLFSDHLARVKYTPRELAQLFLLALGSAELGHIPSTNDQVLAGSADTVRLDSPRGVFVLGLNEGVFPARGTPAGVFTDREREALIREGVEVAAPGVEKALLERFYLYSALGAPRERLWASWARSSLTGEAMEPSLIFTRLLERFPERFFRPEELPPAFFVASRETARAAAAAFLAEGEESLAAALLEGLGEGEALRALESLSRGLPMGEISPSTAKKLLGGRIALSPTRVENFYRCPCLYYCEYLLKLSPRKRAEYSPLESGTAIHYVLERLLTGREGASIAAIPDGELRGLVRGYLEDYLKETVPDAASLTSRLRYQFERLASVLFLLVRRLGEEFSQSAFRAVGVEVPVGEDGVIRPRPMAASDGTPVTLAGKIDRVDTFRDATGAYGRVVDYKSGGKEFRLEEVLQGLNMQMLIYLFALCDDPDSPYGPLEPAGILYMPGKLSAVRTTVDTGPEEVRRKVEKKLQMSGLVLEEENVLRAMERELEGRFIPVRKKLDDSFSESSRTGSREDFSRLREVVRGNILRMAEALLQGQVAPAPARSSHLDPCASCDYRLLCGAAGTEGEEGGQESPEEGGEEP